MILGSGFVPTQRSTMLPEPTGPSDTERILIALADLRFALASLCLPTPVIHLDPPDLGAIVTAVNGLKPGASADDIARAVKAVIVPPDVTTPDNGLAPILDDLSKALTNLDFRMQGPTAMIGGGILHIDPAQLDQAGNVKVAVAATPKLGTWTPYAGSGPATVTLAATESLMSVHAYCNGTDATVAIGPVTYTVRQGTGFDYSPAKPPVAIALVFAAGIDYFIESSK